MPLPHIQPKMMKTTSLLGHIPKEISRWSSFFIDHNGFIEGIVTGARRYSEEAGGMEILCELTFTGKRSHVSKLKRLIENLNSMVIEVSDH